MSVDLFSSGATVAMAACSGLIEAAIGYPNTIYRVVRHPVVWFGSVIAVLERWFNRADRSEETRRWAGMASVLILLLITVGLAAGIQAAVLGLLPASGVGSTMAILVLAVLGSALPAQRSLHRHVAAVSQALRSRGLAAGRVAVAHIVGRDTAQLDEAGVARAAIESLAENFADGVVGPLFWGALGGLPGLVGYKAINTADSMIGHRTARFRAFGWAAARLDDLVNLPASRLSAVWLLLAAWLCGESWHASGRAVWRDASRHRSPNAGWPEAAMAGALGLRLAGPRRYGGEVVADAWMGHGRAEADANDIDRALRMFRVGCGLQLLVLAGLAAVRLR